MELAELKKKIHASIDMEEDMEILLEIKEMLEMANNTGTKNLNYESSPEFNAQIDESIRQAKNSEVYGHEETMNYLKNRSWRTK